MAVTPVDGTIVVVGIVGGFVLAIVALIIVEGIVALTLAAKTPETAMATAPEMTTKPAATSAAATTTGTAGQGLKL